MTYEYNTGDCATNQCASPGTWENGVFTAPDGSKWKLNSCQEDAVPVDNNGAPAEGTGTYWLVPYEE